MKSRSFQCVFLKSVHLTGTEFACWYLLSYPFDQEMFFTIQKSQKYTLKKGET